MKRGTTPTNTFAMAIDISEATVFISYEQNRKIVIEKTNPDLTFTSDQQKHYITLELSQEDTLAFVAGEVLIQIRYVFPTGDAGASNIIRTTAERIIKDGVIRAV